jgi:hypothetical protein
MYEDRGKVPAELSPRAVQERKLSKRPKESGGSRVLKDQEGKKVFEKEVIIVPDTSYGLNIMKTNNRH